jgi:hypothetical protein
MTILLLLSSEPVVRTVTKQVLEDARHDVWPRATGVRRPA